MPPRVISRLPRGPKSLRWFSSKPRSQIVAVSSGATLKTVYIVLGAIALGLGVVGIFLPVLPTTPFLLLAAGLWCKGSPKLYNRLLNTKHLGPYIRNFRENRAIPLRAKIVSVAMLWTAIGLSAFLAVNVWWLRIVLLVVAVAVTWHILSFKTLKKQ